MTEPFDLQSLRQEIGNDPETEIALLELFLNSTEESLQTLSQCLGRANDGNDWASHFHQIKGAALNLGAKRLEQLCLKAQEPSAAKEDMLKQVESEFHILRTYINEIIAQHKKNGFI